MVEKSPNRQKKKLIKTAQTKKRKQLFQIIQKAPLAWLLMHLNKTPYLKDYNATTLWQNIPSLLNLGIHTNTIMSKMASYRWL